MNKKSLTFGTLLLGVFLLAYGIIWAPLANTGEIRNIYSCDRLTRELTETDKYCANPETAPEARKQYSNGFVYSGVAIPLVAVGLYAATNVKSKNK